MSQKSDVSLLAAQSQWRESLFNKRASLGYLSGIAGFSGQSGLGYCEVGNSMSFIGYLGAQGSNMAHRKVSDRKLERSLTDNCDLEYAFKSYLIKCDEEINNEKV